MKLLFLLGLGLVLFLASCVSYTYPLGENGRGGSITFTARYNPPSFSVGEILGWNQNIQRTLKDKK